MEEAVLVGQLIVLAAIANAGMDLSADGKAPAGWNKSETAGRKWKNGDSTQGERFFLSSTVLVFLTDFWHLSQFVFHSSWQAAVVVAADWPWWSFFIVKAAFSLIFEIGYRYGKAGER